MMLVGGVGVLVKVLLVAWAGFCLFGNAWGFVGLKVEAFLSLAYVGNCAGFNGCLSVILSGSKGSQGQKRAPYLGQIG